MVRAGEDGTRRRPACRCWWRHAGVAAAIVPVRLWCSVQSTAGGRPPGGSRLPCDRPGCRASACGYGSRRERWAILPRTHRSLDAGFDASPLPRGRPGRCRRRGNGRPPRLQRPGRRWLRPMAGCGRAGPAGKAACPPAPAPRLPARDGGAADRSSGGCLALADRRCGPRRTGGGGELRPTAGAGFRPRGVRLALMSGRPPVRAPILLAPRPGPARHTRTAAGSWR